MIIHRKTAGALARSIRAVYAYITNLIKKDLLPVRRIYRSCGKVETARPTESTRIITVDYINGLPFSTGRSFMLGYVI